ncbi:MAG: OmpA family protein [Pseudomonadota bacterium]
MRGLRAGLVAGLIGLAGAGLALDLPVPEGADKTADVKREAETIHLPTGPHDGDTVPRMRRDGDIHSRAWRLPDRGHSTLQILDPLRTALKDAGWSVIYHCASDACGGFDFRVTLPILPAPAMFVDLFDFRYLLATRGAGEDSRHAALIVSTRGGRGYVQVTHLRRATLAATQPVAEDGGTGRQGDTAESLADRLRSDGYAVLRGLDFASGEATLGAGPYDSLATLAGMLRAQRDLEIALVGHTDTVGAIDGNIGLSRARAEAVRRYLIETHDAPAARIAAHGIGYLAPRGANDTSAARARNRRVEVVVVSGQ